MFKEIDLVQPLRSVIMILKCTAIWRLNLPYWKLFAYYFYSIIIITLEVLFTVMQYIYIIQETDLAIIIDVLYLALTFTSMLVKVINILWYSPQISSIIEDMQNKQYQPRNIKELEFIEKTQKSFNRVKYAYYVTSVPAIVLLCFPAVIIKSYVLPMLAWYPFDITIHHNYWYAWSHEFVVISFGCIINLSLDMLYTYLLCHNAMCYELIGQRLKQVGYQPNILSTTPMEFEEIVINNLIDHIKAHQLCIQISKRIEKCIGIPTFVQTSFSALIICVSAIMLQTSSPVTQTGPFLFSVSFLMSMAVQVYLPCYYGDQITEKSNNLTNALYNSNWYNLSLKCQKLIFVYMEILKKPIAIKAGPIYIINLEIFSNIMNNAYSLFAILKNLND